MKKEDLQEASGIILLLLLYEKHHGRDGMSDSIITIYNTEVYPGFIWSDKTVSAGIVLSVEKLDRQQLLIKFLFFADPFTRKAKNMEVVVPAAGQFAWLSHETSFHSPILSPHKD